MSQGPSGANHTHTYIYTHCTCWARSYQLSTPRILCRLFSVCVFACVCKGLHQSYTPHLGHKQQRRKWLENFKDIYLHSAKVQTKPTKIFVLNNHFSYYFTAIMEIHVSFLTNNIIRRRLWLRLRLRQFAELCSASEDLPEWLTLCVLPEYFLATERVILWLLSLLLILYTKKSNKSTGVFFKILYVDHTPQGE